jgi:hypothetical protein
MRKELKILITDPNDEFVGQKLTGHCVFYDVYYRGGTGQPIEDLFLATLPDGSKKKYLSSQINTMHYEGQLLEEEIERLGAKVGDIVKIVRTGSGSYSSGFKADEPQTITKIDSTGYVEFSNGIARMFRPDVEVISYSV